MAGAIVLVGAVYLMIRWFEHTQIFQPTRALLADPQVLGVPADEISLQTSDGVRLHGWSFSAPPDSSRQDWLVLICHGNGGNISHRIPLYSLYLDLGLHVLAFDYRGYGMSEGHPSEEGTYSDAAAAFDWAVERGFPPDRILVHGESLGGAIVTELALRRNPAGMVLQSTFTSIVDVGAELFPWLPVRWLHSIEYATRDKLPRLRIPVLIIHSREDGLIGFHHAERNFAAANSPKWLHEVKGGHNDQPESDFAGFRAGLLEILRHLESD